MTDISVKAIDSFGANGGILGLIVLLLVSFLVWYIHSSRKHHAVKDEKDAAERLARDQSFAAERREWREALDRNTAGFNELTRALITKPCLRPPEARTRETDRVHR